VALGILGESSVAAAIFDTGTGAVRRPYIA
jgi:hypothetical protein